MTKAVDADGTWRGCRGSRRCLGCMKSETGGEEAGVAAPTSSTAIGGPRSSAVDLRRDQPRRLLGRPLRCVHVPRAFRRRRTRTYRVRTFLNGVGRARGPRAAAVGPAYRGLATEAGRASRQRPNCDFVATVAGRVERAGRAGGSSPMPRPEVAPQSRTSGAPGERPLSAGPRTPLSVPAPPLPAEGAEVVRKLGASHRHQPQRARAAEPAPVVIPRLHPARDELQFLLGLPDDVSHSCLLFSPTPERKRAGRPQISRARHTPAAPRPGPYAPKCRPMFDPGGGIADGTFMSLT